MKSAATQPQGSQHSRDGEAPPLKGHKKNGDNAAGVQAGMPLFMQTSQQVSTESADIQRLCSECEEESTGEDIAVQARLTVGSTNDDFEKQADAVADRVMRMPATSSPGKEASANNKTPSIQRSCSHGEKGTGPGQARQGQIQRKHHNPRVSGTDLATSHAIKSPGQGVGLPPYIRSRVEPVLGADLSAVRVHQDSSAQDAARQLNARAFTHRNNIFLGTGESAGDVALMSHESTHTVQQGASKPDLQRTPHCDSAGNCWENDDEAGATIPLDYTPENFVDADTSSISVPNPAPNSIPEGGSRMDKPGLVSWRGEPRLRLRSSPDTESNNIIGSLSYNQHIQVIKEFPGDWYFISTRDGQLGYAWSVHIKSNLPEPNAFLHRVESGVSGSAIAIAEQYFGDVSDDWGQDLRFYVNVLAYMNDISVPDSTAGWREVHFNAGQDVWIPSRAFARGLKGVVNSGSLSYNIADAIGLADAIEFIGQKIDDYSQAIVLSGQYIPQAIAEYAWDSIKQALISLAYTLIAAIALLAVTTAIGAALGALAGGVGAAPGAAAGFEVGVALLQWLGMALLINWVLHAIMDVGSAFGGFLGTVWNADSDAETLDIGARQFAAAVGELVGALLEAIIMLVGAYGLSSAIGALRGSRFMSEAGGPSTVTDIATNGGSGQGTGSSGTGWTPRVIEGGGSRSGGGSSSPRMSSEPYATRGESAAYEFAPRPAEAPVTEPAPLELVPDPAPAPLSSPSTAPGAQGGSSFWPYFAPFSGPEPARDPAEKEEEEEEPCDIFNVPPTMVHFSPASGPRGGDVTAQPLTWRAGNTEGSQPDISSLWPGLWDCAVEQHGSYRWVHAHLLHGKTSGSGGRNLHGPGDDKRNIILSDKTINGQMSSRVERPAANLVYNRNCVLWYDVSVNHFSGPGARGYFADSVNMDYGYFYPRSGRRGQSLIGGPITINHNPERVPPSCDDPGGSD
jgi:uncharacterized membrane protein YgcG